MSLIRGGKDSHQLVLKKEPDYGNPSHSENEGLENNPTNTGNDNKPADGETNPTHIY